MNTNNNNNNNNNINNYLMINSEMFIQKDIKLALNLCYTNTHTS